MPDQWDRFWQPRHQVMNRLAKYFHVVWVNCPPGWRQSLRPRTPPSADHSEELQIYQPEFWLPLLSRPAWLARFTSRERIKRATKLLRARGCKKVVLYIWRPDFAGALVSPGDGKVTDLSPVTVDGVPRLRISIFLKVFNVHVNRSPISGVVKKVVYQKGKFVNAMDATSADQNEQNIVTVEGDGQTVVFKQIAGLLARRIVFTKKIGDRVERGERVGLIKFGSRVDVLLDPAAEIKIRVGDHVQGGASVLAVIPQRELTTAGASQSKQGAK